MDDVNLQKLKCSKGRLEPEFDSNCFKYKLFLNASEEEVTFEWLTRDKGASCDLKGCQGSSRTLSLAKGQQKEVRFEVTSEDGHHVGNYNVSVERLSGKDTSIEHVMFSDGESQLKLVPEFNSAKPEEEFYCSVPWNRTSIRIKVKSFDPESTVSLPKGAEKIEDASFNIWKMSLVGSVLKLKIKVISQDKTVITVYNFIVARERPRIAILSTWCDGVINIDHLKKSSCVFCCNLVTDPIKITANASSKQRSLDNQSDEPGHLFCRSCIDGITMGSNFHPLNGQLMEGQWKNPSIETQNFVANMSLRCIYPQCPFQSTYNLVLDHSSNCEFKKSDSPFLINDCNDATIPCEGCGKLILENQKLDHDGNWCYGTLDFSSEERPFGAIRGWEVRLIEPNILEHIPVSSIENEVDAILHSYQNCLPENSGTALSEEPARYLNESAKILASAINRHPKQFKLHFKLAQVLEEWNFVNETISYHGNTVSDRVQNSLQSSADSSKEEEVKAICCRHGVSDSDSLAKKLKALDTEYHQLLEWGKLSRADYLSFLYSWKSKKAAQEQNASKFSSENLENPFLQAHDKYCDALGLEQNNAELFLIAGKCDLLIGDLNSANQNFAKAASIRPSSVEIRFFMGLAIVLLKQKDRYKSALDYLTQGFNAIQQTRVGLTTDSIKAGVGGAILQCQKKWVTHDVNVVRGLHALCKLLVKFKPPSSTDIIRSCMFLMQNGLSKIQRKNSSFYHRITWNIFKTYYLYIKAVTSSNREQVNQSADSDGVSIIRSNSSEVGILLCSNLASLIHHSNLRKEFKISLLLEKVCREAVINSPNSSKFLYLLGFSQLGMFEVHEKEWSLSSAKLSFEASIDLESKVFEDTEIHKNLKEQSWFSKTHIASGAEKDNNGAKSQQTSASDSKPKSEQTNSKSVVLHRKSSYPSNNLSNSSKAIPSSSTRKLSQPTTNKPKPLDPSPSTQADKRSVKVNKPTLALKGHENCADRKPETSSSEPAKGHGSSAESGISLTEKGKGDAEPRVVRVSQNNAVENLPTHNKVSYMPRLGLARCMSHSNKLEAARMYYEEVFKMAPLLHEAYIEAGSLIAKSDPLGAVDIYCRYPFQKSSASFDDAYLHGEIVHLITKWNPDPGSDPRLEFHMSEWGKISGINILEKYIGILVDKHCMETVMRIYANVNGKSVRDPDMTRFYKLKGWL